MVRVRYPPIEPDHGRDAELRRLLAEFYAETWAMARGEGKMMVKSAAAVGEES